MPCFKVTNRWGQTFATFEAEGSSEWLNQFARDMRQQGAEVRMRTAGLCYRFPNMKWNHITVRREG